MKLTIELVPRSCWYTNVRSEVTTEQWDRLRKACYKAAGYVCEICGGKGSDHPVECHEIWKYDDDRHTQTLTGLISLCPACHQVKHIGLAQIRGKLEEATEHFASVNGLTRAQALHEIELAFSTYHKRSQHEWKLDISWLEEQLNGDSMLSL